MENLLQGIVDGDVAREVLVNALPSIVYQYGSAAATVGADWYDLQREEQKIARRFTAIVAQIPEDTGTEPLVGWGLSPVFQANADWAAATTLLAGGLQRRILRPARDTIRISSIRDPSSRGWRREGAGKCDWCRKHIMAGTILHGDLACHDHCGCQAVPVWV